MFYESGGKYSIHAEQMCLSKCKNRAKGGSLILVRVNKEGNPVTCRPCPMCQKMIDKYQVRVVWIII